MAKRLSDRIVKAIKPADKSRIVYDNSAPGFGVRTTPKGVKSFIVNYVANGRERRLTIGRYPIWSVAAARNEAHALRQMVDGGRDPMAERDARRREPTVGDLCDRYLADHARPNKRPSSVAQDERHIKHHVKPAIGSRKVSSITFSDIDRLHRKVSATAPIQANRMAALLSKMFTLSIRWQYRTDNPAKGLQRNQEAKRHRYLSGAEIARLVEALREYPYLEHVRLSRADALARGVKSEWQRRDKPHRRREQSANAIRLLMLTGARRGETLAATWEQFDLDAGVWTKPGATTKQKTQHRVPLSAPARELLVRMKEQARSEYVFPSRKGGPQRELKNAWDAICELANLEDVRVHDLRHTYASQLVGAGMSLPIIGALLGHTQPGTTARYAHLADDPLRKATERVGALYDSAATGETAQVLPFARPGR